MKNSMNFSSSALGTHSLVGILVLELGIIVLVVKTSTTHCQYNISELVPEFIQNWFRRFRSRALSSIHMCLFSYKKNSKDPHTELSFSKGFSFSLSVLSLFKFLSFRRLVILDAPIEVLRGLESLHGLLP